MPGYDDDYQDALDDDSLQAIRDHGSLAPTFCGRLEDIQEPPPAARGRGSVERRAELLMRGIKVGLGVAVALVLGVAMTTSAYATTGFLASKAEKLLAEKVSTQVFTTNAGKVECTTVNVLAGTTSTTETAQQLALADYEKCKAFGFVEVTISPAHYLFLSSGTVHILKLIKIFTPANGCEISVPAQATNKVDYKTNGNNILIEPLVASISYTQNSNCTGGAGSFTNGTYAGHLEVMIPNGTLSMGGPPVAPPPSEQECGPTSLTLQYECVGKPVNNATGNETLEQTDASIAGRGPGLGVVRTYDSSNAAAASEPGVWGFGWRGPYDTSLTVSGEEVLIHEQGGSDIGFFKSGTSYTQGGWDQARLEKSGSNYIYTLPDQSKLEFNGEGELVKETERNGNSNTFTYNGSKQLEKVKDGDERLLTFKYNASGLVESATDPMGHTIKYTYSSGNLSSVTIESKERWKFEYESHLLTNITDGRGHATTIKYETGTHKVIEETIGGHKRKWSYGTNETKLTEPNGSETLDKFNTAGEPTKVTRAKGTSVETVTEYEYEASTYARTKLIDPNKHNTEYKYEEGNKISEKDPGGDERKWKYDKAHNILEETTAEGETTTIKRNEKGEPTVIERPIGTETQKTELKYGTHGELTEEIDPLGHATKYIYDAAGDKETETDAAGDERKWKYNEDSQVTEETSARGFTTKITRDEQGRPTRVTDPLGHLTEYTYDGNGNVESETDGNKHTTKYEYNEENLRTRVEEPNKTLVETGYDAEGQMTSHTDGNKHTWEYKRNLLEQVTEEKTPLGKLTVLKYEKAGNLETREDPEKHTTTYRYDSLDRPTLITYSTGKPSEVTFAYNKDNKVTLMKDETGLTENTWDKLDRLTKYKNGAGKAVEYEYNLANLPVKITYPSGEHITREYDKANRLEKVTDFKGNVASFDYNKDGQLEKTLFPTGTEETDEYAYNEADQLTLTKILKKADVLASLEYERDNVGQVKKTTSKGLPGGETSESVLDENNRLIEANKEAYEYDKANNPLKIAGLVGYTYNEADELTESHEAKYTYNEDGQRTKTEPKTGESTTYTYDQVGNLTAVKQGTSIEDSYTYDGNNLRQLQDVNGTVTHLTWDTAETIPITLEDETNSYVYGPEGLPIEQVSKTGAILYFHHDQEGSTRLLTNAKGEAEAAYTYNPYGSLNTSTGAASTPLRYDAQYTSTDTGFIYLRARTYDPKTAQFPTVDPALRSFGEPYAYTKDNPENRVDPTGKCGAQKGWHCAFANTLIVFFTASLASPDPISKAAAIAGLFLAFLLREQACENKPI